MSDAKTHFWLIRCKKLSPMYYKVTCSSWFYLPEAFDTCTEVLKSIAVLPYKFFLLYKLLLLHFTYAEFLSSHLKIFIFLFKIDSHHRVLWCIAGALEVRNKIEIYLINNRIDDCQKNLNLAEDWKNFTYFL